MGYSILISSVLVFSVFSCGSSGEKSTEKNSADSVEQLTVKQDTVPEISPINPAPTPGTVHVLGKVVSIQPNSDGKGGMITFKISRILQYGASTPAIASQDTLKVGITNLNESLEKGKEITAILKHRQVLAQFKDTTAEWQLVDINNN